MRRYLIVLVCGLLLSGTGGSQEPEDASTEDDSAETAPDEDETPEVDDESYIDAEDEDFRPSEEIPTDQSIPFPTDI
jgi:hypothetical protein